MDACFVTVAREWCIKIDAIEPWKWWIKWHFLSVQRSAAYAAPAILSYKWWWRCRTNAKSMSSFANRKCCGIIPERNCVIGCRFHAERCRFRHLPLLRRILVAGDSPWKTKPRGRVFFVPFSTILCSATRRWIPHTKLRWCQRHNPKAADTIRRMILRSHGSNLKSTVFTIELLQQLI